ncbi:M23 family metallopeptidase [Halocalculus aciditolerans]|uniref:M23ase beta-sheet core domain-containing protein n=1 Tax=Halocalculus aciditolerans TaxID=1383812 RepID=A0A830F8Q9_9EURY|nr:M23 family metallopeptidase [Halocalculus aciditolerans]GGL65728.1 hypothetical protein GCM10009039_24520 [Halocalculus aciditolerans]
MVTPSGSDAPRPLHRRVVARLAGVSVWVILGVGFALGLLVQSVGGPWWLAFLCYLMAGLLPVLLQAVSTDDTAADISNRERAVYTLAVLRWAVTPWGVLAQLRQLWGQVVAYARYRGAMPNTVRGAPKTTLSLPFDGEWTVMNGGVAKATSHSWEILSQRYAYDFAVTDADGESHAGDGASLADYYAFGREIRAPAAGTVVAVRDRLRDYPKPGSLWLEWRTGNVAGNHVTIEHADGEYSFLAHLKAGSTTVEPGDSVEAGDVVGRCGNSGHSTEPHLHYQLQDAASFWTAAGLPPRFTGVDVERDSESEEERSDADSRPSEPAAGTYLVAGDRVSRRTAE